MRELTPGKEQTARVAANDSTLLIVQEHIIIIGCVKCGGVKNHLLLIPHSWTMHQIEVWDKYYEENLSPCLCNVPITRMQSMEADITSLEQQNLKLELEKLDLERQLETRKRLDAITEETRRA